MAKKIKTEGYGSEPFNLEPYSDRVILRKVVIETRSSGGIILSENEDEDNRDVEYGEVLAVGEGKWLDKVGPIPMKTKVGDLIAFNGRMPLRFHYRGEYLFTLRESDILFNNRDKDVTRKNFESFSTFDKTAKPMV